eukprot:gene3922-4897_t
MNNPSTTRTTTTIPNSPPRPNYNNPYLHNNNNKPNNNILIEPGTPPSPHIELIGEPENKNEKPAAISPIPLNLNALILDDNFNTISEPTPTTPITPISHITIPTFNKQTPSTPIPIDTKPPTATETATAKLNLDNQNCFKKVDTVENKQIPIITSSTIDIKPPTSTIVKPNVDNIIVENPTPIIVKSLILEIEQNELDNLTGFFKSQANLESLNITIKQLNQLITDKRTIDESIDYFTEVELREKLNLGSKTKTTIVLLSQLKRIISKMKNNETIYAILK